MLPVLPDWIDEVKAYCQLRSTSFAYDEKGTIITEIKKINNHLKNILINLFSSTIILDSLFEKYNEALSSLKEQVELTLRRKHLILHEQYVAESALILEDFIQKCETSRSDFVSRKVMYNRAISMDVELTQLIEKVKNYQTLASMHFLNEPYFPDQDYEKMDCLLQNPLFFPEIVALPPSRFLPPTNRMLPLLYTPLLFDNILQRRFLLDRNPYTNQLCPPFLLFADRMGIGKMHLSLKSLTIAHDTNLIAAGTYPSRTPLEFDICVDFLFKGEILHIGDIPMSGDRINEEDVLFVEDRWKTIHSFDIKRAFSSLRNASQIRYIHSASQATLLKIKEALDEKLLEDNKILCAELIQDPLFRKSLNDVSLLHEMIKDYGILGGFPADLIKKWEGLDLKGRTHSYLQATTDTKPLFPFRIDSKEINACREIFSQKIILKKVHSPNWLELYHNVLKINEIEKKWKELSTAGKLIAPISLEQQEIKKMTQELEETKSKNRALEERLAILETLVQNLILKNSPQGD